MRGNSEKKPQFAIFLTSIDMEIIETKRVILSSASLMTAGPMKPGRVFTYNL
jgi:hypothetical protein